jgi:hypothetical protein
MTLRPVAATDSGPIDAEARAMMERVLARRPLAIMVIYETAKTIDFDLHPRLELLRDGFATWAAESLPDSALPDGAP